MATRTSLRLSLRSDLLWMRKGIDKLFRARHGEYEIDGNVLSAHAGGIVEHDEKWYWFGQNERAEDKDFSLASMSIPP
ncbi:hypothetical protein K435DRAFT_201623 [Dendrothele bispora CBS 962.96]|uniref:Uncharacterized protein n=1 Tax=Dendrothele bispora (strain CBS 962.96) TaxID=1314807 RepID=A0A4S8MNC2_DENBC|nr:hypothetical protein K435DRAFT_201623 [Dendrothele bispora CBS 962.96]